MYIEVPHAESIEMWRPRMRRQILTLPAHLYHFTPSTLEKLLSRAGLELVQLRVADAALSVWIYALWTRWRRLREPERRRVAGAAPAPAGPPRAAPPSARRRLIATATRLLPGWKFQAVARVRSAVT